MSQNVTSAKCSCAQVTTQHIGCLPSDPVWYISKDLALLVVQIADRRLSVRADHHPAADSDILQRLLDDDQQLFGATGRIM